MYTYIRRTRKKRSPVDKVAKKRKHNCQRRLRSPDKRGPQDGRTSSGSGLLRLHALIVCRRNNIIPNNNNNNDNNRENNGRVSKKQVRRVINISGFYRFPVTINGSTRGKRSLGQTLLSSRK